MRIEDVDQARTEFEAKATRAAKEVRLNLRDLQEIVKNAVVKFDPPLPVGAEDARAIGLRLDLLWIYDSGVPQGQLRFA